jgi:hypothetical protein
MPHTTLLERNPPNPFWKLQFAGCLFAIRANSSGAAGMRDHASQAKEPQAAALAAAQTLTHTREPAQDLIAPFGEGGGQGGLKPAAYLDTSFIVAFVAVLHVATFRLGGDFDVQNLHSTLGLLHPIPFRKERASIHGMHPRAKVRRLEMAVLSCNKWVVMLPTLATQHAPHIDEENLGN